MNGSNNTSLSYLSYYNQPGSNNPTNAQQPRPQPTPMTPPAAPVSRTPQNPPVSQPLSYPAQQRKPVQRSSSPFLTILLIIGIFLLCGGIILISGTSFGPFETSSIEAPVLQPLPAYTNQTSIIVNGSAQANMPIEIYVDNQKVNDTRTDANGKFVGQFKVEDEKNYKVTAIATRNLGLRFRSPFSNTIEFTLDRTTPQLTLNRPTTPVNKQDYSITGKVNERARVVAEVKGQRYDVATSTDGSFTIPVKLDAGNNNVAVVATDLADNKSRQETLTVAYVAPAITPIAARTPTPTPSVLPRSSGSLSAAMTGEFSQLLLVFFSVVGLTGYGASHAFMWLLKTFKA
jgi:hypothetical protein